MMAHRSTYPVIMALSLLTLAFSSCEKKAPEKKEIIRPVKFTVVSSSSPSQSRTFSGVAKSGVSSNLSFKVNGTINQVSVKVGDRVPRQGLIASLDPTDYKLQLQKTQASLDRAKAEQIHAASVYERTRQLYENNNVSTSEFDAALADFESKKANVTALKNQLELEKQQLKYTELRAPSTCSIASIDIEKSENVKSGQQVIITTCGDQAEVDVGVPESVISRIKKGGFATVTFNALSGSILEAVVTEVGVAVTGTSSTFPVTVQLLKPNKLVKSGMSAEVTFILESDERQDRILLDLVAVKEDMKGQYVFVIAGEEKGSRVVRKRYVQPGELYQDRIEIIEGLKDGELVVTAGASRLRDGQKVSLLKSMRKN